MAENSSYEEITSLSPYVLVYSIGIESCRGTTTLKVDEVTSLQSADHSGARRWAVGSLQGRTAADEGHSSGTYNHAAPDTCHLLWG